MISWRSRGQMASRPAGSASTHQQGRRPAPTHPSRATAARPARATLAAGRRTGGRVLTGNIEYYMRTVCRCQPCSAGCGCCKTHHPPTQPQPTSLSRRPLGTDWAMSGGRITCLQQGKVCGDEESCSATRVHAVRGPGQSRARGMGQFRAPASYALTGTRRWSPHSAQSTCSMAGWACGSTGGSGAATPQATDRQHMAALSCRHCNTTAHSSHDRVRGHLLDLPEDLQSPPAGGKASGVCAGAEPAAGGASAGGGNTAARRLCAIRRIGAAAATPRGGRMEAGAGRGRQRRAHLLGGLGGEGWRLWCSGREQARSLLRGSAGN